MRLVYLVSFFWMYVNQQSLAASTSGNVNLGAIFTFGSINGAVSKIAMKAAQDDINADPRYLGGRKLSITMHDSNFSGFLGLIGALKFMATDTVAIVGPQNSVMAHILSNLANELHVLLMSFTALDPTLTPFQFPYFIQTAPSDLFQLTAIADMISYFGWRQVIAIYSDDDQSRNGVILLKEKLSQRRVKLLYTAALPPDPTANISNVEDELLKISKMKSRVFVLHTFSTTGLLVFDVAKRFGMMEKGFVWFASTWLSTVVDSKSPLPPSVANAIQGVLTLRPHIPDSKAKRDFSFRWSKLSNGSIGLNSYGFFAYDTVWMIAGAVKLFLERGNTISFSNTNLTRALGRSFSQLTMFDGGSLLLKNVLQTNMTGLSGPLRFDSNRAMVNPCYDIMNILESGYQEIGYWSNNSRLSVNPLSRVVWPGGTTTTPRGWIFPDNGRHLRIGIPNRVSYREFVSLVNDSTTAQGYCIDVFLAAIKLLPYAVPFKFIPFGNGRHNPSYNELVNRITAGEFDAVVGDIAIVTNRTKIVDFSQPYIESGLVVVAPVKTSNASPWAFLRPFTPMLWCVTGIFFLLVGFVVWILEHKTNDEFRGPPRQQIVTIFWFSFSTMFFSHREDTHSTLGRFVVIIWLFVVLLITSSYTASLTSILTVQQLSSPISGIHDLMVGDQRIGFQVGSFAENYMREELGIARGRLVALGSPHEYATALANGTVAAVVDEQPYVEVFLSDHCRFSVRGQEFTKSGWGFAFRRDSPLAVDISTAILTLSENGNLQKIHDKWLFRKTCGPKKAGEEPNRLQLKSFWGLFVICGVFCVIAISIFTCNIVGQFRRFFPPGARNPALPSASSRSKRLQTFLSFVDDKAQSSKRKTMEEEGSNNSTARSKYQRSNGDGDGDGDGDGFYE